MGTIAIRWNIDDSPADVIRFAEALQPVYATAVGASWEIDFSECQYLGPDAAALIYAAYLRASSQGQRVEVKLPTAPRALLAFCQFSGLEHYLKKGKRPDGHHPDCETVPLSQFFGEPISVGQPVVRLVSRHMPDLSIDLSDYLSTCITEVVQNMLDHSESNVGGVRCARYFVKRHEVRVALVDHGIGIGERTRRGRQIDWDDVSCLGRVLQGEFSARTKTHNAGIGLNTLWNVVRNHGGSLLILSGTAVSQMYGTMNEPRTARFQGGRFPGTAVFFSLRTDT
ncbi:MAG: hypothetical protein K2X32_02845 [Phycisphaerales bacterium]|nr:hypothetical protein [Phycisphaerales bacterium]